MKASIYQRKSDNKWVGAIKAEKGTKGKKIVVYGDSKEEVEEKTNVILFEIQTNQYISPIKDTLISFLKEYHQICSGCNMWNDKFIRPESAKWEETTAELFKMYIDVHFEPYFKDTKLKDIKALTLDTFYNFKLSNEREHSVKQGKKVVIKKVPALSINTVIKLNKFLKAAFNYAIINDKLKKNPTDGIKLSSQEKYKPNVYDKDKFLKLLDAVQGRDEEIPVILGAGCGMRRGEICGLTWGNIDFENRIITIEKTETRFNKNLKKKPKNDTSSRKLKASGSVIDTLKAYYELKDKPNSNEKVVTRWKPQSLSGMFSDLLEEHELEHIRLHDLRHYNAVIMLRNGISDKVAAERLGHANVSTLREVYQHVLKEMDEEAADKINDFITIKEPDRDKPLTRDERKKLFKAI